MTAATNHAPATPPETEDERKLREAMESMRRGEGMVMTEEEEDAIRREVEELMRRGIEGVVPPTLERFIERHKRFLEEKRAAARE